VNDVIDLFPGLKRQLRKADRKEALSVVGGVEAEELVIGGADLQIGKGTTIGSRVRIGGMASRRQKEDKGPRSLNPATSTATTTSTITAHQQAEQTSFSPSCSVRLWEPGSTLNP
jgi:hypothetical protein